MKKIVLVAAFLLPALVSAQQYNQPTGIDTSGLSGSVTGLTKVVNSLIPLGIAIAVIAFIYGVIKYLLTKDPEGKKDSRTFLINGVLAITVILAIFGIARLLINLFGLNPTQLQSDQYPQIGTNPPEVP